MTKEEQQLKSRLTELAEFSWQRQVPVFSDFLGLNEQNIYHSLEKELQYASPRMFGGYELAERQMLVFGSDALFPFGEEPDLQALMQSFPITCVRICPTDLRFAQKLTHRDYLGAALGTGIERDVTGDILLTETEAYLFCEEKIGPYLVSELTGVRHTRVSCEIVRAWETSLPQVKTEQIEGSISSVRLDALLALAFHASRSSLKELPESRRVFRNGALVTDGSARVREGDIISVRGLGRFRYLGESARTRKGRLFVRLEKYV